MTKIHISTAGRLREPYWLAACEEYKKRLGAHCKLSESECADDAQPGVPEGFYAVALCIEGEALSSEELASHLRDWQNQGKSRLCFLIGGSDGLSEAVKRQSGYRLSLSRLTLPHHMARAVLYEQVYRSFQILSGGKYHK